MPSRPKISTARRCWRRTVCPQPPSRWPWARWAGFSTWLAGGPQPPSRERSGPGRRAGAGLLGPAAWRPNGRSPQRIVVIRLLTEIDCQPFSVPADPDADPQDFSVDLARAAMRGASRLPAPWRRRSGTPRGPALRWHRQRRRSSPRYAVTPEMRAKVDFTDPYYRTRPLPWPPRFPDDNPLPEVRRARRWRWWPAPRTKPCSRPLFYGSRGAALSNRRGGAGAALRPGDVDLLFGDAVSLAFWLNGTELERVLRLPRRPLSGPPLLRRERPRHQRSRRATRPCASRSVLGAVSGSGEQERFTDLWLPSLPDQRFKSPCAPAGSPDAKAFQGIVIAPRSIFRSRKYGV